jgi:hypothetical protein
MGREIRTSFQNARLSEISLEKQIDFEATGRLDVSCFCIFQAKKAFEAWSSKKEVVIKTEVKNKKEIKNKELDEKREKVIKKQDAKKFFESWKSKKDEVLKDSYKDKKAKQREDKQRKIEDHKEKIEIAKKAFDKW